MVLIGIDIGGTFTDIYIFDEGSNEVYREKVSTTPENPSEGVIRGVKKALSEEGIDAGDVSYISHGSTIATNAMLEREGADTGLITTEGFRDVIAIGREKRSVLYDTSPTKTPTYTERKNRVGVSERLSAEGDVIKPVDDDDVMEAIRRFEDNGVESIAVSLLHAYRNPEHERQIEELIQKESDLPVSLSSDVMAEIQEYERTLSTVINAYVQPLVEEYIQQLQVGLDDLGIDVTLHLMQASGGVMTPDTIESRSIQLINSGPAGGVIGAQQAAGSGGIDDIITLDMGGTSADACVVKDGEIETTTEGEIGDVPLHFHQIDVRTVGAGGGSIAWLDRADVLKIGPKSAGARPGPACYGRGGENPTVTDAALLLGYLNPDYFLGGEMELDEQAARDTVEPIADAIGEDIIEISEGILDIATTNMKQAIDLVTVEKGYDPRTFGLVCYGGAGPLFATRLARKLGIDRAFIPNSPGVLSATGMLAADKRFSFSQSRRLLLKEENLDEIEATYAGLEQQARDVLQGEFQTINTAEMRYEGQTFDLAVDFRDDSFDAGTLETLVQKFESQYEAIYGYRAEDKDIEIVTMRQEAIQETKEVDRAALASGTSVEAALKGSRPVYVGHEYVDHDVYDRYQLPPESRFEGPAIIEEAEATTVAGVDTEIQVDVGGNLHIHI